MQERSPENRYKRWVPVDKIAVVDVGLWNYHSCKGADQRTRKLVPFVNELQQAARRNILVDYMQQASYLHAPL